MTLILPLLLSFQFAVTPGPSVAHRELPRIVANENRRSAGELRDGVLTVHLVAQDALLFPDGETGNSIALQAFGEEGKAPTSSAPLIRVRAGTELRITLRNTLAMPLLVRGLYDGAAPAPDSVDIAPNTVREVRFRASVPGTYFYWGRTTGSRQGIGSGEDGQLLGAFIVDSSTVSEEASDRVMVMNAWFKPSDARKLTSKHFEILTVNGRSWPFTERLGYTVGDTIHWRVINGTFIWHPMHLHGFYYRVDSRGDGLTDTVYSQKQQRTAVTEWMRSGSTMRMTWSPSRPGNWLFHCHLVLHIAEDLRLTPLAAPMPGHAMNPAMDGMAGLVMGIVVKPRPGQTIVRDDAQPPEKTLRLYANTRANFFGTEPGYSFVLQEGPTAPARDSMHIPGTPIRLIRGERTEITVLNRTPVPISVHWHGIELESYYDGVGGWSGSGTRVAPTIGSMSSENASARRGLHQRPKRIAYGREVVGRIKTGA